jgi:hypothetical protein
MANAVGTGDATGLAVFKRGSWGGFPGYAQASPAVPRGAGQTPTGIAGRARRPRGHDRPVSTQDEPNEPLGGLPSNTGGEIIQAVARGAVSAIPFIGGPAAELIGLALQPALERRRDVWFGHLGRALEELRVRLDGFDPAQLAMNELFITAVVTTSNAALRTHEAEKLDALRNAVVNSALPMSPNEHIQLMFIGLIDDLTALHLRLLAYLQDPDGWFARHGIAKPNVSSRTGVLEAALPDLANDPAVYRQAVRELAAVGLAQDALGGMVTPQGLYTPLTTEFGNRFLAYVTAPP